MGGYGATRIGMKHADVFGSLYIMSPCCLSPRGAAAVAALRAATRANDEALAAVKTPADSAKLPFGLRAQLASAAAWSPNPKNPPLYLDLPIGDNAAGGPGEVGRQRAAGVHRSVHPGITALSRHCHRRRRSGRLARRRRQAARRARSVRHREHFEIYPGTHTSEVAVRFQEHVMPFFSRTLSFEPAKR